MARPKTREEYIKRLKVIYDGFSVKDLTWEEFRNQALELENPEAVARMRAERGKRSNIVVRNKRIIT